jgi:hypothetical protein
MSYSGSLSASRENTPPYRSVSYNPPAGSDTGNKPTVRSASWTSEAPVMPPLSVNVNLGPATGMCYTESFNHYNTISSSHHAI